jgi:hypothetical protein
MKPLQHLDARLDQRLVVLGEISDSSFMTPDNFSAVDEGPVVAAGFAQFRL